MTRESGSAGVDAVKVAVAVVVRSGRFGPWILIGRRFPDAHLPDLWEFPGGKLHPGEEWADCARREVLEETGVEIQVRGLLLQRPYPYPDRLVELRFFACSWISGTPAALGSRAVRWTRPENLDAYPFPDANAPILAALREAGWI